MKVLFVCSGNIYGRPNTVVMNQGESLLKAGVEIDYFTIIGKGITGYLKNIPKLIRHINANAFLIVHAHYSLSAFVASVAIWFLSKNKRPKLLVSLLGSDAYLNVWMRILAKLFYKISWQKTIVKTHQMKGALKMRDAIVLPNGVDVDRFQPIDKDIARKKVDLNDKRKIVLFLADPARPEKNYSLAEKSIRLLNQENVLLLPVFNVPTTSIHYYLNAADLLLLTSKWEGSVNVVKEAMACNIPIVSTDVGDVNYNTQGVEGCFITPGNPEDVARSIDLALRFNGRTNGREKLISMGLDSESVAKCIVNIYEDLVYAK